LFFLIHQRGLSEQTFLECARRCRRLDEETLKALAAAEVPARFAYLDKIDLGDLG
jgi:hypothetical protein